MDSRRQHCNCVSTIQSSCPRASLDLLIRQIRNTLSSTADAVVFVFPAGVGRLAHSWVSCASATTFLLYTRYSFCPAIQIAVFPLLGFDLVALPRLPLVTASLILTLTKKNPGRKPEHRDAQCNDSAMQLLAHCSVQ